MYPTLSPFPPLRTCLRNPISSFETTHFLCGLAKQSPSLLLTTAQTQRVRQLTPGHPKDWQLSANPKTSKTSNRNHVLATPHHQRTHPNRRFKPPSHPRVTSKAGRCWFPFSTEGSVARLLGFPLTGGLDPWHGTRKKLILVEAKWETPSKSPNLGLQTSP